MIVVALPPTDRSVYSCTAYLVMGAWKRLWDCNTLVDTGSDAGIVSRIEALSTGVGKKGVEQVVLTHGHFDHSGGLAAVSARWQPKVMAWAKSGPVSHLLNDGDRVPAGSGYLEVIHVPGHTQDSICLYSPERKALFSGDTPLALRPGDSHNDDFVAALERLAGKEIRIIYPGHGEPISEGANAVIRRSLEVAARARRGIVFPMASAGGA